MDDDMDNRFASRFGIQKTDGLQTRTWRHNREGTGEVILDQREP